MPRAVPVLDLHIPHSELSDLVSLALHDLTPAAVHETGSDESPVWRVFFTTTEARDAAGRFLMDQLGPAGLAVAPALVEDADWAARSQASLGHVRVGRIVVAPPWDVPQRLADEEILIVIKPSMGFGTGHHESTRLCLGLLQQVDVRDRVVLDAGWKDDAVPSGTTATTPVARRQASNALSTSSSQKAMCTGRRRGPFR